jgi:hypothetical protein
MFSRLTRDIIAGMTWGEVELEPEVPDWLEGLDDQRWAQAMFHLDLLEERGVLLGEPYTRQLSGKLRELRFYCGGERIRISYWIASGAADHRLDRVRQDQDARDRGDGPGHGGDGPLPGRGPHCR